MEIIGRRWTGAIIRSMLTGASRYSEILAAVPGLSDRLLSERLKELEHEGIVERTVTPSTPVRVDYSLTEKGRGLAAVVREVAQWAERWGDSPAR
ncbi:MAG: helix-turn-helix transcriptional regulator [Actinomycetota bacterium]|nr:helix-turn-helix transcriptional regulator [Actinomycetota bacterium]